jgi:spore photoproduct lyase
VAEICRRFSGATIIQCEKYGEVFNRKAQNFRLQKQRPALILAQKHDHFVLPAPPGFGIGGGRNYYFSHMLNCIYDCRYCFLQGMYQSAHYVLFVNYEAFAGAIAGTVGRHLGETVHFFSGYDCDSLALEPVTGFAGFFLPVFAAQPSALLELRTKSTQIRSLLSIPPLDNCIIAYSLAPAALAGALEHKAPDMDRRIQAMRQLQQHGWQVGLRFDPLIYQAGFKDDYSELFSQVFTQLDEGLIHSVSLGSFRLPKAFFRKISRLYPDELLFASALEDKNAIVSYKSDIKRELLEFCRGEILRYIPGQKFFPCESLPC